jgi:hypothetical protein
MRWFIVGWFDVEWLQWVDGEVIFGGGECVGWFVESLEFFMEGVDGLCEGIEYFL